MFTGILGGVFLTTLALARHRRAARVMNGTWLGLFLKSRHSNRRRFSAAPHRSEQMRSGQGKPVQERPWRQ
jgi:hypothetical protein